MDTLGARLSDGERADDDTNGSILGKGSGSLCDDVLDERALFMCSIFGAYLDVSVSDYWLCLAIGIPDEDARTLIVIPTLWRVDN